MAASTRVGSCQAIVSRHDAYGRMIQRPVVSCRTVPWSVPRCAAQPGRQAASRLAGWVTSMSLRAGEYSMDKIGFIGLGRMGVGAAQNARLFAAIR